MKTAEEWAELIIDAIHAGHNLPMPNNYEARKVVDAVKQIRREQHEATLKAIYRADFRGPKEWPSFESTQED